MTIYYVYRGTHRRHNRMQWDLVSKHREETHADTAARALCPPGEPIHAEPGNGLDRGFYGSAARERWSAMVTVQPYHGAA